MAGDVSAIINLSGLVTFFRDDPNCITKGETKYNANFVLEVKLHDYDILSSVRSSFKDKSYKTKLNIDGKGSIKSATCDCPRGNWICSHMAATAIYVNKKGFSKTDLPNSWIKRPKKQAKHEEVKTMEDYFPSSNPTYKATPRPFTIKDREAFFRDLSKTDVDCPFRWLLSPEVEKPPVYAPGMEETHGALEIKCPYVHREHTIREMIEIEKGKNPKKNLSHFFLDENLQLNRCHDYWHQVQAEMVALETHWAHFVVWTTKDILVILIYKDDAWAEENLPKLKSFYLQQLLPVCFTTEK